MRGFLIWALCGGLFVVIGIYALRAKKPVSFWANTQAVCIAQENGKAYNRAVGKLWCVFGAIFVLLGLPLLAGQNAAVCLISILGSMFVCIVFIAAYIQIEAKFRKR